MEIKRTKLSHASPVLFHDFRGATRSAAVSIYEIYEVACGSLF